MGDRKTLTIQTCRLWMVALAFGCMLAGGAAEAADAEYMRAMGVIPFNDDVEAPNFMLPTPDGKTLQLRDFKGKLILLNFWATW
jgi:cytochrome c biogenesis protein CcmG/thiol:disulfide interchange protein DsbE